MLEHKGYRGTVEYEDGELSGRVIGLRDVITLVGRTAEEMEHEFRESVDVYLEWCDEQGKPPEQPSLDEIAVSLSRELHRKAIDGASTEGLTVNDWIARRIEAA